MRWTDKDLFSALGRYEQVCIANGMSQVSIDSYRIYADRFLKWRTGEYAPRGTARPAGRPTAISVTIEELAADAKAHARSVEAAGLVKTGAAAYLRHAMFFVRWLDGTFEPGGRLRGR